MSIVFNGPKFRKERKKRKITQSAIAEAANISDRYVRYLETGEKKNPSAAVVLLFSKELNVPPSDLMTVKKGEK